jgi:hypothetical protein
MRQNELEESHYSVLEVENEGNFSQEIFFLK